MHDKPDLENRFEKMNPDRGEIDFVRGETKVNRRFTACADISTHVHRQISTRAGLSGESVFYVFLGAYLNRQNCEIIDDALYARLVKESVS